MDLNGILLIDKAPGLTSYDVVKEVKNRLHAQKAGHSGTLDKSASGLLIVCVNSATAVQNVLGGQHKKYRAVIFFGIETDTLDRYGRIVKTGSVAGYTDEEITGVLNSFKGKITQVPPAFSAIHQHGKRLYKKALRGDHFTIEPREIEIKEIALVENRNNRVKIDVLASKGTYIRSLARDIAVSLGTCGYLEDLRRVMIGSFSVNDAIKLDEVKPETPLIPLSEALQYLPCAEVDSKTVPLILNGVPITRIIGEHPSLLFGVNHGEPEHGDEYIRVLHNSKLIAILERGKKLSYFKVFREDQSLLKKFGADP